MSWEPGEPSPMPPTPGPTLPTPIGLLLSVSVGNYQRSGMEGGELGLQVVGFGRFVAKKQRTSQIPFLVIQCCFCAIYVTLMVYVVGACLNSIQFKRRCRPPPHRPRHPFSLSQEVHKNL